MLFFFLSGAASRGAGLCSTTGSGLSELSAGFSEDGVAVCFFGVAGLGDSVCWPKKWQRNKWKKINEKKTAAHVRESLCMVQSPRMNYRDQIVWTLRVGRNCTTPPTRETGRLACYPSAHATADLGYGRYFFLCADGVTAPRARRPRRNCYPHGCPWGQGLRRRGRLRAHHGTSLLLPRSCQFAQPANRRSEQRGKFEKQRGRVLCGLHLPCAPRTRTRATVRCSWKSPIAVVGAFFLWSTAADWDLAKDAGDAWLLRNGFTIVSLDGNGTRTVQMRCDSLRRSPKKTERPLPACCAAI